MTRRPVRKKHRIVNGANREIQITPPSSELDSNVRAILTHLVKHLGTITFELGDLPTDGFIMWDIAQRPDGSQQITVWWAEGAVADA
jgi:hypothetical protein